MSESFIVTAVSAGASLLERASVQFDAAARAANDRSQGRRRALPDPEIKSKPGEHLLDTFGVGMFANKIEERDS